MRDVDRQLVLAEVEAVLAARLELAGHGKVGDGAVREGLAEALWVVDRYRKRCAAGTTARHQERARAFCAGDRGVLRVDCSAEGRVKRKES